MGLAHFFVNNYSTMAKVVLPVSFSYGLVYSLTNGSSAMADAKQAVLGPRSLLCFPCYPSGRTHSSSLHGSEGADHSCYTIRADLAGCLFPALTTHSKRLLL